MDNKHSPYSGMPFAIAAMLGLPLAVYLVCYAVLRHYEHYLAKEVVMTQAVCFAGIIGSMSVVFLVASGSLSREIAIVRMRLAELIIDLRTLSFSSAMKWYRYNLKLHGVALWIYLPFMAIPFVMMITSFLTYVNKYLR